MKSVQTHFQIFQNRDDGALDAFVCILCIDSLLQGSERSFEDILCVKFTASCVTDRYPKRCVSLDAAITSSVSQENVGKLELRINNSESD
jgi:hypothetical protein